jgi:hypothetical protein
MMHQMTPFIVPSTKFAKKEQKRTNPSRKAQVVEMYANRYARQEGVAYYTKGLGANDGRRSLRESERKWYR